MSFSSLFINFSACPPIVLTLDASQHRLERPPLPVEALLGAASGPGTVARFTPPCMRKAVGRPDRALRGSEGPWQAC